MPFDPDAFVAALLPRLRAERLLGRVPFEEWVDGPVHLAALGKPAVAYATAIEARIPVARRLTIAPHGSGADIEAGHPLPDAGSLRAGEALLAFARALPEDGTFLFFVAGGGSALAELPRAPHTLEEIIARTRALLGRPIAELNAARAEMSALKGGRLGEACPARQVVTLVLSDVPGADLDLVASGPVRRGRRERVAGYPELAAAAIECLRAQGIAAIDLAPALDNTMDDGVALHRDWIGAHARPAPWALVSGGELPVAARGSGRGGRNSEFVVRLADALRTQPGRWR
ncbi:MAG: DUF4147 domain-containing protein, partial [Planctomycetota bacterium]